MRPDIVVDEISLDTGPDYTAADVAIDFVVDSNGVYMHVIVGHDRDISFVGAVVANVTGVDSSVDNFDLKTGCVSVERDGMTIDCILIFSDAA